MNILPIQKSNIKEEEEVQKKMTAGKKDCVK